MDLESLVISIIVTLFGGLLSVMGAMLLREINAGKKNFKQAKIDFINKIDEIMNSYATMLNTELVEVKDQTEKNTEDIKKIKKDVNSLKAKPLKKVKSN